MTRTRILPLGLLVACLAIGCEKDSADKEGTSAATPAPSQAGPAAKAPSAKTPPAETPPAKAAISEADEKLMAEMIGMMEKTAAAIDTHRADCSKMATELEKLAASNKMLLEQIVKSKDNEAMGAAFAAKYQPRTQAIGRKMSGVRHCKGHRGVEAAMGELGFRKTVEPKAARKDG